jgi:predicted DNA-binding transcriptional regulator AlpA
MTNSNSLIPARTVRRTLGNISDMTMWRWLHDEHYSYLDFPKPITIASRRYWKQNDIDAWLVQVQQGGDQ